LRARGFARPIEQVTEIADQISQGNLDFTISTPRRDQIGDLIRAMHGVRETLQRFVTTERQIVEAAARGDFSERGDETSFQNAFRDMVRHLNHLMEVASVLAAVAKGALTVQMEGAHEGTFASLKRDINTTVEALARLIHQIELNRGLLRATLEHLPQGVSVVDADLRLIAWNRRYVEIFGYPADLVYVGRSVEALMRYNAARGLFIRGNVETNIERRAHHLRTGTAHAHERELPGGVVLEIRGNPVPGVGYATSYTDVSAYKRAEEKLRALAESLERRVSERTEDLQRAMAKADRANLPRARGRQCLELRC
jgi:PAS domain S-box-containing protein